MAGGSGDRHQRSRIRLRRLENKTYSPTAKIPFVFPTHTVEFPAVVLNLASGEVVSEFQQYVQPQEHPRLSKFCTKLTGITQVGDYSWAFNRERRLLKYTSLQAQVDNGVPLPTCIWLFNTWLRRLREEKGIELMEPGREYSEEMALSALGTWTGEQ